MPIGGILQLLTEAIEQSTTSALSVVTTFITVCFNLRTTHTAPLTSVCTIIVFNNFHFVSFQESLI